MRRLIAPFLIASSFPLLTLNAQSNKNISEKNDEFNKIEKIESNKVIWRHNQEGTRDKQVIAKEVADTLNWMLEQAVSQGTGSAASLSTRPVAGKTGTSDGNRDLWFIGSLPQLTTGVWFGNDNNNETIMNSGNAAWAWKKYIHCESRDAGEKYKREDMWGSRSVKKPNFFIIIHIWRLGV